MIAIEAKLNGDKITVAGAEHGKILMSDIIIRHDPKRPHRTKEASFGISGGNGDGKLNIFTENLKLKVGDKISIKILQTDTSDSPTSTYVENK